MRLMVKFLEYVWKLLYIPIKPMPSEQLLYLRVCAAMTPQPRPSYTLPSFPIKKLYLQIHFGFFLLP